MEIQISKEFEPEVKRLMVAIKLKSIEEFINRAIKDKILQAKKERFIEISNRIHSGLKKKGIEDEHILEDFERKRV